MSSRLAYSILLPCLLALLVVTASLAWGGSQREQAIFQPDLKDVSPTSKATTRSVPTPTRFPYINVTRQQYDAALAKWRAQGITEYEIVVDYYAFNRQLMGKWTLHVQTDGTTPHVISASRWGEKNPEIDVDFLTVEDMFSVVEDRLNYISDTNLYWNVSFHPTLGYPSFSWQQQPDVHITDIQGSKHVEGVRIIKQNPPGGPYPTGRPVP